MLFLGAKIGQRVVNNQPVRIIDKSPIESIREKQDSKELKKQQEIDDVIKHNIDVYDGTSLGQKIYRGEINGFRRIKSY